MTEQVPHTPVAMHYTRSGHAHKQGGGQAYFLAMTFLVFALFSSAVNAATISSGYSGMWYDPARSGEGLQLEILSSDVALVEWYTYDSLGKQRWIQGVGNIAGDSIQFPQVYTTQGGKFGPAFNPDDVKINVVGSLSLTFGDCNTGTFKYTAFGQSQTLPIQRLTLTMGAGCAPINGVPGEPVQSYAGQSGSWYNATRSGEGFDLQWLANGAAVVTWYTYDASGNQVWLLGVGSQQGNAIVFDQMAITNGPKFGAAYNKADLQQEDWGSLTLTLDCNGGTAHYASKQAAFGSGDLTLTRLTHLQQPACPYVQPKLSDLYDIAWNEIPIAQGTPANPNIISAESIANDGTIAGRRGGHLVLWHPDTRTWEDVPRQLAAQPVGISPDGMSVIATDALNIGQPAPDVHTLLWQRSTGWQALLGLNLSIHYAISHDFKYVVGTGRDTWEGGDGTWVQAVDGTQQLLSTSDAVRGGIPYAVSDDGTTVVGITIRQQNGFPTSVAVRWVIGGAPSVLHDPAGNELAVAGACDADCNIIFGGGMYNSLNSDGGAWYLKSDGTFAYLERPSDASSLGGAGIADATPDGSLAVGLYTTYPYVDYPDIGALTNRPFIWTQATGVVSLRSLADELKIGDDDWGLLNALRVSADGRKILVSGTHTKDLYQELHSRAVVLQLTPKVDSN